MPKLTGKVALITGASRGIGRAIALRFAAEGATVVVSARSFQQTAEVPGTLAETVELIEQQGGKVIAIAADLEVPEQRDMLLVKTQELAGGLDILVNNAGYADYVPVAQMPAEVFERTLDHYLRIPFYLCQSAIALMRERGAGWILNIGSVTALPPLKPYNEFDSATGVSVYAAAKAAINRFSQGLAAELLADNIAVNALGPSSAIRTPGGSRYIPDDFPAEPVEYLVEAALDLCSLPAQVNTGRSTHSVHYVIKEQLPTYSLDGKTLLPMPELSPWAHPDTTV